MRVRLAAAIGLALLASACGTPVAAPSPSASSPSASASSVPPDPALASFYSQTLTWNPCGRNQCATLEVPLDYAKPAGERIKLALLRIPATDQQNRVGSLVIDNGGPGGSGVDFTKSGRTIFGSSVQRVYDLVGLDPRGVGGGTELKCGDTALTDAFLSEDPEPATAAERAKVAATTRAYGQSCLTNSGELARHLSTEEAARDMDILRAALGDAHLNYMGFSWGTFLGASYADLFPTHVGRMVLDGAVDPSVDTVGFSLAQAHGFEVALRAYVSDCVDRGGCYLGTTVDSAMTAVRAFLDQLKTQPLPTRSKRPLTQALATVAIITPLYVKGEWPALTRALTAALRDGTGDQLLGLADFYAGRGPDDYISNEIAVLTDVNCLDHDELVSDAQVDALMPQFLAASPTFGRTFAYSLTTCANWPIVSGKHTAAVKAHGAPPIVVIGTTRDPATPFEWAKALAKQLESGVLVTRDGDGHTAYHEGNFCIDTVVEDFLTKAIVPINGKSC